MLDEEGRTRLKLKVCPPQHQPVCSCYFHIADGFGEVSCFSSTGGEHNSMASQER